MENIDIAKVGLAEIEALEEVSKRTFIETYGEKNTADNMEKYLLENFSTAKLIEQVNNPDSEFYLAVLNTGVIGYIKINIGNAQTETGHDNAIELERIYVVKEKQGKKIGQLLCNKAFQLGQKYKADYLWLGVWEENLKAIRFYKKYGFVEFGKHIFKLGEDDQKDIMMKLKL
ncbi:MAG: GNAT family N-acetyltransferase [Bacteroidetes bacterium]|nr:GNAT family N-acetyltransferase [Bacteroidota bacterium]